jgi:hypothetical protein
MKYLVSVKPERVADQDKDKWADDGEPVIPAFPAPIENVFLSVASHKKAPYAMVRDMPDLNLEQLAKTLCAYYPGLPPILLENYVLATALAADKMPPNTRILIGVSYNKASVFPSGNPELSYTLWTEQPMGAKSIL